VYNVVVGLLKGDQIWL